MLALGPDPPPHLPRSGVASVARALAASYPGRAPQAGWSRRAVRRMALRAHHAEPAEPNPQRSLNAFPRARALPVRTFRPEINGPAATGSPAWSGRRRGAPRPRGYEQADYAAVNRTSEVLRN